MRSIAGTPTPGPRYDFNWMGDSIVHNYTLSCDAFAFSPAAAQALLRDLGARVRCRNFAHSGNTSQDEIARFAEMTQYGVPKIAFLSAPVNDPGSKSVTSITRSSGIATATTAAAHNLRVGDTFTIAGAVQTDYNITGTVLTVPSTTSVTYTVANAPATPATGTITWRIPTAQSQANVTEMAQSLIDDGTEYILIGPPQYLNWTSGGDLTSQIKPGGSYGTLYDTMVATVAALVIANPDAHIAFTDVWTYMKLRIVGGTFEGQTVVSTDTALSASWHVAGTNQHLNAYGEGIVAQAVVMTIQNQSGWLNALKRG